MTRRQRQGQDVKECSYKSTRNRDDSSGEVYSGYYKQYTDDDQEHGNYFPVS